MSTLCDRCGVEITDVSYPSDKPEFSVLCFPCYLALYGYSDD